MSANSYVTAFGSHASRRRYLLLRKSSLRRDGQYWARASSYRYRFRALPWRSRATARVV